jgi:uncharacterized repeat protein (TIGR01451 family)
MSRHAPRLLPSPALLPLAAPVTLFLALAAAATPPAGAQCVSLSGAYTQSFDTLAGSGTTNALALTGWVIDETGSNANDLYTGDNGATAAGDTYAYGATGSGERALGGIQSGSLVPLFGACFTNATGATLDELAIAYTGEQWRLGTLSRADSLVFAYSTDATSLTSGTWTTVPALTFTAPTTTGTLGALDGNASGNRTNLSTTLSSLAIANGASFWIRFTDTNATSADDGLAVDDVSLTPQGGGGPLTLDIGNVTAAEGNPPGTTTFSFQVTLTGPAPAGGVSFDLATADGTATDGDPVGEDTDYVARTLADQTIPEGSAGPFAFEVTVNRDSTAESNETFFVNVTDITGAAAGDTQGQGTISDDDNALDFVHEVQGNATSSPLAGQTVTVEGVVTADFQGSTLEGFFLQEEDADTDGDPATSEGVFVFCSTCPTAVAEGQRVQVTGTVSEFFGLTQISAASGGAVSVVETGNHLDEITPSTIDLPVVGDVNAFYEAREGMLVQFVDQLTVAEYFELARFGQIELFAGGRPHQFTATSPPGAAGLAAHNADLARRRVIVDDDNNEENVSLAPHQPTNGQQFVYHPRANGGLSIGTQGVDFFRGGDSVANLTGVLDWSWAGTSGTDAWRIRPTAANPVSFTVGNPRPVTVPAVGGAIRAASVNVLNYFTTIDTTVSNGSGPCGPAGTADCRGADSVAELNRQRERASIVLCSLDAHVLGLSEIENDAGTAMNDLLGAVNARCGGADPYAFASTGSSVGSDVIRVAIAYRSATLAPVGSPLVDLAAIHSRPPTAQTFEVVGAGNPALGEVFTVVANHFKSKGCGGASGADTDQGDGQGCFNNRRTQQASRLLTWLTNTVVPAAGDPDVLLLGDFNAYGQEDPITTLAGDGYVDLMTSLLGAGAYSYVFDGQLGHLDYALASSGLASQVTGVGAWHINADEIPLFDYSDEIRDTGEAAFEEKPDGSALVPPRVLFETASPYRASDHDPVLVGLFPTTPPASADLSLTKVDGADPMMAGRELSYLVTVTNGGPDAASTVGWSDTLPTGTTFVALSAPGGWSCTTPAVGAGGSVSCSTASLAVGSAAFTLAVAIDPGLAEGTILANTATATTATSDPDAADRTATATTTVVAYFELPADGFESGDTSAWDEPAALLGGQSAKLGEHRSEEPGDAPVAASSATAAAGTLVEETPRFPGGPERLPTGATQPVVIPTLGELGLAGLALLLAGLGARRARRR